jgi:hypothetical protein
MGAATRPVIQIYGRVGDCVLFLFLPAHPWRREFLMRYSSPYAPLLVLCRCCGFACPSLLAETMIKLRSSFPRMLMAVDVYRTFG